MEPEQPISVTPPASQPNTQVVVPQQVAQALNNPSVLVTDTKKAWASVKSHYLSPAFWYHLGVQVLAWVSYFQTASTPVKIGAMSLSLGSFATYVIHLIWK